MGIANCPTTMIESARWKNSVDPSIVDPGCIHRSWLEYPIPWPDLGNGLVRQVVGHATNIGTPVSSRRIYFRRENFLLLLPIPEAREFDLSSFSIFSVGCIHTLNFLFDVISNFPSLKRKGDSRRFIKIIFYIFFYILNARDICVLCVLSKGIHTMRKRNVTRDRGPTWKVTVFRERRRPLEGSSGSRSIFPVRRKTNGWAGTYLLWIKHRFQARVQPRFVNSFGFQPARARTLVKEKKKKKPSTLCPVHLTLSPVTGENINF